MTSKIRVLSDQTINQIAAGEVIENPASVVKELIENAVDAGATHLTIEILSGGFQWIKISDDGHGMSPDDAVLSLERHATSKIVSADDLFSLATMGFRGEALASIAAISKLQLTAALENAPATAVEVEGGKITHVGLAARARGTTIEVRSLFYNVPARKKFQKSAAASSAEITKVVTQLALAHPEIGFELIQQNHSVFSLPTSSGEDFLTLLSRRASVLLSQDFLPSSHAFELQETNLQGKGLIGDPLLSRHNRSGQFLFVNRRPVFCLPISYAIRDAYGTRLSADRHPVYLLHLSIPSALVDVNVHPQKKEIRLRDESQLKYALHAAVNAALGSKDSAADFSPRIDVSAFLNTVPTVLDFTEQLSLKEETILTEPEIPLRHELNVVGFHQHYLLVDAKTLPTFLFSESEKRSLGVVWFDLPAVEARIQFDSVMRHAGSTPISQGLLMPIAVSFSRAEMQLLSAHLESVQKLGLQLAQVGDTAFLIEAMPPFLQEGELQKVLEELIEELQGLEKGKVKEQERLHQLASCITRRCRLRKQSYGLTQARKLIEQLILSPDPAHCPQGKPTLFHIREDEIENYFCKK